MWWTDLHGGTFHDDQIIGLLGALKKIDEKCLCITQLAEAGAPEETVMAIGSHVDGKMLDHYPHIRLEARCKAVALLDAKSRNGPEQQTQEQPAALASQLNLERSDRCPHEGPHRTARLI
jgi:hypothetical protein